MNCMTPYQAVTDYREVPVPCGRCPACIRKRQSAWLLRLKVEERYCSSAHWITLTYADKFLPWSDQGYPTLTRGEKSCVTLFMKRLRKANPKTKLKYFYAGEYGEEDHRPHYHMMLFNSEIKTIQNAWQNGSVFFGNVENRSIIYSLKYMEKRLFKKRDGRDDRVPEFTMMSKGLGSAYLTPQMVKWHRNNEAMYSIADEGQLVAMPRYYKDKIWTLEEREEVGYKQFLEHGKDQIKLQETFDQAMRTMRSNYNHRLIKSQCKKEFELR